MSHFKLAEGEVLSLRHRARRFWIEEKRLEHIGRSLLFHLLIAVPLKYLLHKQGLSQFCAIVVAVTAAVTIETVYPKPKAKETND